MVYKANKIKQFINNLEETNLISLGEVLSLENSIGDNIITGTFNEKLLTEEPSNFKAREVCSLLKQTVKEENMDKFYLDRRNTMHVVYTVIANISKCTSYLAKLDTVLTPDIKSSIMNSDNRFIGDLEDSKIVDVTTLKLPEAILPYTAAKLFKSITGKTEQEIRDIVNLYYDHEDSHSSLFSLNTMLFGYFKLGRLTLGSSAVGSNPSLEYICSDEFDLYGKIQNYRKLKTELNNLVYKNKIGTLDMGTVNDILNFSKEFEEDDSEKYIMCLIKLLE